jgi:hypothetical protein
VNHRNTFTGITDRDRALFKKYTPAIRLISKAGWEPITWAWSDNPSVYVERFGTEYLTVLNDSYVPDDTTGTLVGSGGTRVWFLETMQEGPQVITGNDERSWEAPAGGTPDFTLTLEVGMERTHFKLHPGEEVRHPI